MEQTIISKKIGRILLGIVLSIILIFGAKMIPCYEIDIPSLCSVSEIFTRKLFRREVDISHFLPLGSRIYQSEKYGFEIKYPDEAKLFGDFDKDKLISIFDDDISEGTGLNIKYLNENSGQVAREIVGNYEVISDRNITFNGYSARELIHKSEVGGPYRVILISRGGGTFQIKHWVGKYDDILSTFKFVE